MALSLPQSQKRSRSPLPALSKLTIIAMVGIALSYAYLVVVVIGAFVPMIMVSPIALVLAGIVATGRRWAPLVAALVCIAGLVPEVLVLPGHFDDPAPVFILNVLLTPPLFLVAILAGIGATVHNYRRAADPRAPRWLPAALCVVGGVILGGSVVAARPHNDALLLSPDELAVLPTVTTRAFAFDRPEIQARVGEPVALRLQNDDSVAHRFDLDAFNVHVSMFRDEQSVAFFVPTHVGSYTFRCNLPGHEAMQGTVIVHL